MLFNKIDYFLFPTRILVFGVNYKKGVKNYLIARKEFDILQILENFSQKNSVDIEKIIDTYGIMSSQWARLKENRSFYIFDGSEHLLIK